MKKLEKYLWLTCGILLITFAVFKYLGYTQEETNIIFALFVVSGISALCLNFLNHTNGGEKAA